MLAQAIKQFVKEGDFVLASGRKSKYYIDMRHCLLSSGLILRHVGAEMSKKMQEHKVSIIGGPANAGIIVVTATLMNNYGAGFFVRKEVKEHGLKDLISGDLKDGDKYMMVDDVGTTGGSMWRAIQIVQETYPRCECVLAGCVLDREEGASEFFASKNVPFFSLTTLTEVLR